MSTTSECRVCQKAIMLGYRVCWCCAKNGEPEPARPSEGFVRSMPCSGNESKHGAENKPTGRMYRTVDELTAAECSPEVQAEYARLRAEEGSSPNAASERLSPRQVRSEKEVA